MDTREKIKFGLEKLTLDIRDYSHDKHFGTLGASQLPTQDFNIYDAFQYSIVWGDTLSKIAVKFGLTVYEILQTNPKIVDANKIKVGQVIIIPAREITILNQLDLDFCTGFATAEIQKCMFGLNVDPYYQFAKIKQERGEYTQYGANLRDAAKSVTNHGSLPEKYAPYTYSTGKDTDRPRDFLANWLNYTVSLDNLAAKEKDLGYFNVDGPYDMFDNIRSILWLHRQDRRGVSFGLFWHYEWNNVAGGIIPSIMPTGNNGGGHDMAIVGQKTINGNLYLIFQQSWGPTSGDRGFFYFPRVVVDKLAQDGYGAYTFSRFDKSLGISNFINRIITSLLSKYA